MAKASPAHGCVWRIQDLAAAPGLLLVAACLALPNAYAIALRWGHLPLSSQARLHAVNLGHMLLLGFAASCGAALSGPRHPRSLRCAGAAVALAGLVVGALTLPESLTRFAERHAGALPVWLVLSGVVTAVGLLPALAAALGLLFARPGWRWAALVAAVVVTFPNNFVLDADYLGLHLFLLLCAFAFAAAALRDRLDGRRWRARRRAVLWVAAAVGLFSVLAPGQAALQQLAALEGAPFARPVARARHLASRMGERGRVVPPGQDEWFTSRRAHPPIAPTAPSLLPPDPIVVLITVDSLRADLLEPAGQSELPFLGKLRQEGTFFSEARAAGSSTTPSLNALFSGRYYSQVLWRPLAPGGEVWPASDLEPRLGELLQRGGVHTFTAVALSWLLDDVRVTAGWSEAVNRDLRGARERWRHALSSDLIAPLKRYLQTQRQGPHFAFLHLMDAHDPYDSGADVTGPPRQRYVSELRRVDRELAELFSWCEAQGLGDRMVWLVSADHGEAFGEHQTHFHGKSVYDELLRVPLLVRLPGGKARRVDTPVSLVDLGPTLLDLFGLETPGTFMGESLVPALRGMPLRVTRPIAAETRLKQALLFPDGMKAIYDEVTRTAAVFDLTRDPRELFNLVDHVPSFYLDALHTFFDAHRHSAYPDHAPYRN